MAKQLAEMPKSTRGGAGRESKYNWEVLFDGSVWQLTAGEDFDGSPKSFRTLAWKAAKDRGFKVSIITMEENTIALQATENGAEPEEAAAEKVTRKPAVKKEATSAARKPTGGVQKGRAK